MKDEGTTLPNKATQPEGARSLTTDIALAVSSGVAGGAAGGAAGALVTNLLNRPPKEQPPTIELPSGVSKD
jgi:hypothetical protein